MNALEYLIHARNLLSSPEYHTIGAFARDADGNEVEEFSHAAVCWCSYGALRHAKLDWHDDDAYDDAVLFLEDSIRKIVGGDDVTLCDIVVFNDKQPHAKILEAFDLAITMVRNGALFL